MSNRFKGFGLGSKRKPSANPSSFPQIATPQGPGVLPGRPNLPSASSSVNNIPMNAPGAGQRPPSYTVIPLLVNFGNCSTLVKTTLLSGKV